MPYESEQFQKNSPKTKETFWGPKPSNIVVVQPRSPGAILGATRKDNLAVAPACSSGLVDAHLGGQVVRKRVALPGRGKRGGARTLVAFKRGEKAFCVYGIARNDRANISAKELRALKLLAKGLLNFPAASVTKAINAGELIEIEVNDDGNQDSGYSA